MTQATATTTAKAVRQHGGGLVHAIQPRAALRGRHQCPRGGVKKSLCCAAAGITALDLQATATRAYPMTGVRQAQKLSTSLRSPIRPPAQPVEGYKPSSRGELELSDYLISGHASPQFGTLLARQNGDGKQQLTLSKWTERFPVFQQRSKHCNSSCRSISRNRHGRVLHNPHQNLSQHLSLRIHIHCIPASLHDEGSTLASEALE